MFRRTHVVTVKAMRDRRADRQTDRETDDEQCDPCSALLRRRHNKICIGLLFDR